MKYMMTLLLLASVAAPAAGADAFACNKKIGRGVNLGNALEAPTEGAWGVRLEEGYFKRIAEAGFNSVRIPVRWSAHMAAQPPYAIDKTFLARVDWAVDQALANKLVAIVNIHHYEEMASEPEKHKERFLAIWSQLAPHFRERPADLYFELLNEPCRKLTNELWNPIAAGAIAVIRKTNPTRTIVVGPGNWNNVKQLPNLKLPEKDRNLIATFHYYLPFKFTHQGASWVGGQSKQWLGTKWTASEKEAQEVRAHLDAAAAWAKENRRPLFMGEFGAYSKADMASRARWTEFVRTEAEKRGISWAYWEFCAGFGVYDPKQTAWRPELRKALVDR
jgi:endoglucanase